MNIFSFIKKNYVLIGIVLLGAILRFYKLDFQSVWLDEIHTMKEANPMYSLSEIYGEVLAHEQMPPIYFYVVHFLFKFFAHTPFIARLFSAVIGVSAIYSIYLLGKEMFDKRVGIIAAALVSVNYFQLYYSQEARPYIFLFLFTTLSFYYLVRYVKDPTMNNALLYGALSGLMLDSHFFALFVLAAQYVILFLFFLLAEDKRKFFVRSVVSGVITLVLFIPAVKILIGISKIKKFHLPPPALDIFTKFFKDFFGNSELLLTMVGVLIAFYFIRLAKEKDTTISYKAIIENKMIFSFAILAPWIVISILIPLVRSYLKVPMLENRYFMALLPAIIVLLSVAISQFENKIIRNGLISIFVIFSVTDILVVKKYYSGVHKSQWREVSQFVIDNNKNDEPVATSLSWHYSYLLDNDKVHMKVLDKPLEKYVEEMMQNPSMVKSFWYVDAHYNRPYNYTLSEAAQKFMDDNLVVDENINLHDAWAKHFTTRSVTPVDVSAYKPLRDKNGDEIKFWVENFTINPNEINVAGWAFLNNVVSTQSKIKLILVSDKKSVTIPSNKIIREDLAPAFNSDIDLSNSGFSTKINLANIEKGDYRVGIMIENKNAGKGGLVLTDKTFSKS